MHRGVVLLAAAAVGVGVLGEAVAFDWDEPRLWVPDLVVGWTLLGTGLAAWAYRRDRGTGVLLGVTGLAWFLGFSSTTLYLHRGPLAHLIVAYAGWRARSRLDLAAIVAGYVAAVVPGPWGSEWVTIVLAVGLIGVTGRGYVQARGRAVRDRLAAMQAGAALGGVLILGAVARMVVPGADAVVPALLAYEVVLCGIAVGLFVQLGAPPPTVVTDLVVELGESRSGTLRDRLAVVVADPTLQVGYWSAGAQAYVTDDGTEVELPAAGSGAAATYVARDGSPFAVLIHDELVLRDPVLVDAVASATRLTASHGALQAEVRVQLDELSASRGRLLAVADDERRRLEDTLRQGPQRSLAELTWTLDGTSGGGPQAADHLHRAQEHLVQAGADLDDLALGLHPRALAEGGLCGALEVLVQGTPCRALLDVDVQGIPAALEPTIYYLCAEALANVTKHARATEARVEVSCRGDVVLVEVTDDGAGGADPAGGTGLQGLSDRLQVVGGTLAVSSPPGHGTRLSASLPVQHPDPGFASSTDTRQPALPKHHEAAVPELAGGRGRPAAGATPGPEVLDPARAARDRLPGRWVLLVVITGYAVASVGLVLTISTPTSYPGVSTAAAGVALVAGLGLIAVGMVGVWDRASLAVAPVAVALGVVWFAPVWVGWPAGPATLRSVAMVVAPFLLVLLGHLGLAFPTGRMRARRDRVAVSVVYLATCGYSLVRAGVRDPFRDVHCWSNCADNVFLVTAVPGLARALDTAWLWMSVAVGLMLAGVLVRRLGVATRAGRGLTWPVLVPVAVAAVGEATYAAALLRDPAEDPSGQLFAAVFLVRALALAALAGGLAWAWGRQRWARRALSGLAADLGEAARPGTLSGTLARALGDPSVQVGYWLPDSGRYVDRDGRDLGALEDTPGRARTRIERNGVLAAVVLHDPGVPGTRDLQAEIGPATALAIDNERLRAGVLAQVEDLRTSRARVVQASDTAREQLERDLHDGAQQRLLAVTYELRLARAAAHAAGDQEAERVLASATDQAHAVVAQLRDLAHGIYPAILTEAGLGPAVWSLADEAPLPVEVDRVPPARFPTPVERAVYVLVGHGIDLAVRSGADHVQVDIGHADEVLTVTIGPVDRAPEVHVVDRVGALGGQVTLAGGMLSAEVPCG